MDLLFHKYEKVLPYYTRPLPDELFSSWLIRCAISHNSNPQSFSKEVFKTNNIWNRDIDKSVPLDYLRYFSEINQTSYEDGLKSTFFKYENILFENVVIKSFCRFILPQGIYHRTRLRLSLQFCPICLSKSSAYYRTIWRLAIFVCCPICNVNLHDKCPKCFSPIIPHRNFTKSSYTRLFKTPTQCYVCDFNLLNSPLTFPDKEVYELTKVFQKKITRAGFNQSTVNNDLLYFDGIRSIIHWLGHNKEKLIQIRGSIFQRSKYWSPKPPIETRGFIEFMDHTMRYQMIFNLAYVLNDWPYSILKISEKYKVNYHEFNSYDHKGVPFWVSHILKTKF